MQQVNVIHRTAGRPFAAHIAEAASNAWHAAVRWNEQRKSVHHLQSLSDHHLKDLGIHRSEILSVVYGDSPERLRDQSGPY